MSKRKKNISKYSRTSGMLFRPPLPSPWLQKTIKGMLPFIYRYMLRNFRVEIDSESLERLKALKGQRCLLLPNHPAEWDPWALLELSKRIEEDFYYVVAREVFDWHHRIHGWLLQHMGCYSVVRGASDKDSFKTTKEILAQNKGRLVIFVEGEISNQNDSLLPLEPGVVQLAFLSLQEVYRQNGKESSQLPSLYVCPVAIKYFYDSSKVTETIEHAIQKLEKATGLHYNQKTHYERIRDIGFTVLKETANQVGYTLSSDQSLNEQIKGLEHFMLTKLEELVNLSFEPDLNYLDRVRRIRNVLDRVLKDKSEEEFTDYHKRLYCHQKDILENLYWDLDRIVNFIAIYDGYISPEMVAERYIEVIRRLEREILGHYNLKHPRTAVIKVMEPVNLRDSFDFFLKDKKKASENIIHYIEKSLYQAIISAKLPALKSK